VRSAGERVAFSAQVAALLITAYVDCVALIRPEQALILLGVTKRCAAKMTMNLHRHPSHSRDVLIH
jgi:hypothetical protein